MATYNIQFTSGRGQIDVEYTLDGTGSVTGEAYFRKDDMIAEIKNGEFSHPYCGTMYRVFVPGPGSKSPDAVLMVNEWRTVDNQRPWPKV